MSGHQGGLGYSVPLADSMGQQGAAFPVRSQQWSAPVEDITTHFSATAYSDWVMLVATQTGTLGTVMQARCVSVVQLKSPSLSSQAPLKK